MSRSSSSAGRRARNGDDDDKPGNEQKGNATATQQEINRRFEQPTPSPFKRAALIAFIVLLFWLAFSMRKSLYQAKQQQVIRAKRYSNEFRFRPAASPVITERLKDGRIRLRGAQPVL